MRKNPYILKFSKNLIEYIDEKRLSKTLRTKIFDMNSDNDRYEYEHIMNHFKKWIYHQNSFRVKSGPKCYVYLDIDRLKYEHSVLYGNHQANNIIKLENIDKSGDKKVRSLEELIQDTFKNKEEIKRIEKPINDLYTKLIDEVNKLWGYSFIVNCIPSIINGNYINIPAEYVIFEKLTKYSFIDDNDYNLSFINKFPLEITYITIDNKEYLNIVNLSLIPLFLEVEYGYIYYM